MVVGYLYFKLRMEQIESIMKNHKTKIFFTFISRVDELFN